MEMELLKKLCGETDDVSCLKQVAYTSGEGYNVGVGGVLIDEQVSRPIDPSDLET